MLSSMNNICGTTSRYYVDYFNEIRSVDGV